MEYVNPTRQLGNFGSILLRLVHHFAVNSCPIYPRSHPAVQQASSKHSKCHKAVKMQWKFLAALSLVSSAVLGSPRMANSAEPLGPRASLQATAMNAPLTDWIKNNSTDLQWYTTISVGIPPQAL